MKTTEHDIKTNTKATGRRYASVAQMLRGEGVSKEVRDRVEELGKETRITRKLACMRTMAGLTQAQMAEQIGCSQSCISKWESESDAELTIGVISEYCRVTGQRIGLLVGRPMGHVEAIKAYAFGLRDRLEALAEMANGDQEIEQGIQKFFGEAFFNILGIFENCFKELPSGGDVEVRVEIHRSSPALPAPSTEMKSKRKRGIGGGLLSAKPMPTVD